MSKFNIGDKVKILGNIKSTGLVGFVESIDMYDEDLPHYNIVDSNKNMIGYLISENILELVESNIFEKVMDGSHFDKDNHFNEFGEWTYFAPDNVTADDFFKEMAEIYPKYNEEHNIKTNRFKVCVFEGTEGPIPHVHVYFDQKDTKNHGNIKSVAYICLATPKYAPQHEKETKILNYQERKALVQFFNTEIPNSYGKDNKGNFYQKTCWQACVEHWIDENSGSEKYFEIDKNTGFYIMPDYTKLI